jgi:hypothetical protein
MRRRLVISTPYPTAEAVAEELGVPKKRAALLIRLADSIIARDKVSVRLRKATKKRPARARATKARATTPSP